MSRPVGGSTRSRSSAPTGATRRPPAIEPTRISSVCDRADDSPATIPMPIIAAELPSVVLRIPEFSPGEDHVVPMAEALARPASKEKTTLFAIAVGLVLLAALFFSGKASRSPQPSKSLETEPVKTPLVEAPKLQVDTAWQEPVAPLPPIERYPEYRTADRGGSLAEQVRTERESVSMPSVRLEGTIEKHSSGTTYDGPRSSPY